MRKEPTKSEDEYDYVGRAPLCVFKNRTGLGKKVKRALNKRARRRGRDEREQCAGWIEGDPEGNN